MFKTILVKLGLKKKGQRLSVLVFMLQYLALIVVSVLFGLMPLSALNLIPILIGNAKDEWERNKNDIKGDSK